jgi:hypothetical protein
MIPLVIARQVRETILDYLETTFRLSDRDFQQALFSKKVPDLFSVASGKMPRGE